jgi:hypothetical protein
MQIIKATIERIEKVRGGARRVYIRFDEPYPANTTRIAFTIESLRDRKVAFGRFSGQTGFFNAQAEPEFKEGEAISFTAYMANELFPVRYSEE